MNPQEMQPQPQQNQPMAQAPMNPDHLASSLAFTTHIAEGLHQANPANQPQQQGQPQQPQQAQPQPVSQQDFQKLVAEIQQTFTELPKLIKSEVDDAVKKTETTEKDPVEKEIASIRKQITKMMEEDKNEG